MINPLFQSIGGTPGPTSSAHNLNDVIRMLKSRNPQQIAQSLMQQNPQFKAFVEANKGKTPEQVAQEHGVDLSRIMNQL